MLFLELLACVLVVVNIVMAAVMSLMNEDIKTICHLLWAILGILILIMRWV